MGPIVYTTYGIAMGHRTEDLANSGGLRPAGAEPMRERPARVGVARTLQWLGAALVRVYMRLKGADGRMVATKEVLTAAHPGSR